MIHLQTRNYKHLVLILFLPILLACINPNWLFNPHITDDYIYLGYQMEMPRYTDWFPAANRYFGERVSWIAPTYVIRQLTSPIIANFIIHLGVYYVAIFSLYGIVRKLANPNSAIIVALLMGHYPAFMRAVGWDYVDGFIIASINLCLLLITLACYSPKWWRVYLVGAGAMCTIFITANIFYACYLPVMLIYALWLNHQHAKYSILISIFCVVVGAVLLYGLEGLYYHALTGQWLTFNHSRTFSQTKIDDQFRYINNYNFIKLFPTWHILPLLVMIIGGIQMVRHAYIPQLRPAISLLVCVYAILLIWEHLGHRFLQYAFYSSIVIPMTFIVFGILIKTVTHTSHKILYATFFIPALPFLIFSISPNLIIISPFWLVLGIGLFCIGFVRRSQWQFVCMIGGFSLLGMMVGLSPYRIGFSIMPTSIMTYIPSRYENQAMYLGATNLAQVINQRFERLDIETFRLWYANDPKMRTFHAVASIYLRGGGRVIDDNDLPQNEALIWQKNTRYIPNNTIIILSSQHIPDKILDLAQSAILPHGYAIISPDAIWIDDGDGGFYAVFTVIRRIP